MCDTEFKKGKRYIVYASLDDKTNQFFTGMCTGTTLAVDIDDSLKELRKLTQREAEESISGRIKTNRYQGLPGIKTEIITKDEIFKTVTTKYGDFSFSLPGPGSFTVRVTVPYAVRLMDNSDDGATVRFTQTESLSTFEYDVTLEKSQCSYLELDVYGIDPRATATVSGSVLTATGQAIDKSAVSLINGVETGPDYVGLLKKDGSFSFERVTPGEYYLVLNARNGFDAPYARTYYPATEDKREAKRIQVTEGAMIENLEMRVGPRLIERKVAGTVVWKNGNPLEGAHIAVYSGDEYVRYVSIDENGRFNFILYGDYDYSIEARDYIDEIKGRSQRIKIPQGNSAGLKLVIQRIKQ
ncbi:MAG TPA: carboxypeptidase-like regulatory domain-containing protein [Pyrinomonadaceae bacterium]|nr:carboxypeptidase-like regulatory domain-containing protein [Pyrinomonadaceae bacterium]